MAIDMRRQFELLMRNWGHDIYLQRRILNSASGVFETSVNAGYENKLERYTVRHMMRRTQGLTKTMEEREEGMINTINTLFYFQWDAKPKEGDRIYYRDDRFDSSPENPKGYEVYLIDYALAMTGLGGRVEYWMAGATREEPS